MVKNRAKKLKEKETILYVVRHGETKENKRKILLGKKDVELSFKGKKEVQKIAKKISKLKIDLIFSSPLKRARQTAEIINRYLKKPIKFDQRLSERGMGIFEGLSQKELFEKYQKGFNSEMAYKMTPPGGESSFQVQKRVFSFLNELKRKYAGKRILIVTHSFVGKMINKYFHSKISAKEFFRFQLKTGELKKFKF
jgi:broad specificity phosphatase PhoE